MKREKENMTDKTLEQQHVVSEIIKIEKSPQFWILFAMS